MDKIAVSARQAPGAAGLSTIAAAVLCLAAQTVAAQEADKTEPKAGAAEQPAKTTLETVVVSANRKLESARNVPMAIDVISPKDMDRLQLLDAKDIAKLAAGVEMTNDDGRQNVASMRGVSFNPDSGVSVAAVGVHINDVPVSANVAFNALYDLGQIEVLRGPQGTLRGQMTPAGAITMTTRPADLKKLGGELQFSGDDRGGRNERGAFNLPIITDQLAVRFAAVHDENRLNQVRNVVTGQESKGKTDSYRLSAAWKLTDDLRLDVMTEDLKVDNLQNKQVIGDGVVTPFNLGRAPRTLGIGDRASVTDKPDDYKTKAQLTTAKLTWSLTDHKSLSFVAGYQDIKLDQGFDRDAGNVLPGTVIWQQVNTGIRTHTAEVVFTDDGYDFWNYTLGAYYERTTSQSNVDVASGAFLLSIPGGSTSKAVFTRQSFKLSKELTLDAGARYSEMTTEQQSTASVPGYTFPPSIPAQYAKVVDKPLTWGISLSDRFSRDLTGYIAAGHSFRPGTYQVAVLNPVDPSLLHMGPEKSDALEVGAKGAYLDGTLNLNLAAFVQRYRGYIDRVPDTTYQYVDPFSGATLTDNSPFNSAGDARVQGLEAQLNYRPRANWDINASASWVKSRYTSGQMPCNDSNGDGIPDGNGPSKIPAGQQVAFCPLRGSVAEMPKFSLSLGSEYRFSVGGVQPYLGAQVNHRPGFHSDKVNFDYQGFTNVSLFAGARDAAGKWELGVYVKNALDQQRITTTTTTNFALPVPSLGSFDSGYRIVSTTAPRVIGLNARFSF
jgi:iron complex outermembrane receptor protein